ncbi:MAG TPA: c-type cytochrome domain-containing protein, partial [Tepidisphaeraceae bacterium]|nr:c-type cytochrome domain-containing protein [Tepidisphaeraceae bacterium]
MFRLLPLIVLTLLLAVPSPGAAPPKPLPPPATHQINFSKEIKPLFEAACINCHAKGKNKGGFSLETRESLLKGGDTSPAAIPGQSDKSLVVRLVAGLEPDSIMPKKGTKWTPAQVSLLRAWIDQGLPWDQSINFKKPEPANLLPPP